MMSNPSDVSVSVPNADLNLPSSLQSNHNDDSDSNVNGIANIRRNSCNSAPPQPSETELRSSSAPPPSNNPASEYTAWTIGSTESNARANVGHGSTANNATGGGSSSNPLSPYKSNVATLLTATGNSNANDAASHRTSTPCSQSPPPPSTLQSMSMPTTHTPPHSTPSTLNNGSNPSVASLYQNRLLSAHQAPLIESLLASTCEALNFHIAEMWLRTGPKTHQLTNSHVRPTALDESVRRQLVDVYYGERSAERTHRLSPALCKRAKEAGDVVWVAAHTAHGAEALKCSISDVRTAVAVPVCHGCGVNITIIYFSIRRAIMKPQAVEFLVHMSLATAAAAVNSLADDVMVDEIPNIHYDATIGTQDERYQKSLTSKLSKSAHIGEHDTNQHLISRDGPHRIYSVTGAQLNLQWNLLCNVEYLTDGGNNWIHTAVLNGKSVVIKTLKPECQDVALAINEIEGELEIHSRLDHPNIVSLIGAGFTPHGVRFVVLERLDGGTLSQLLGYDNRIRDRRRRFWAKKKISYMEVLKTARSMADALAYCHGRAIPNAMVLHRDLKPDNIGFALDGTVKIIDFGLARIVENATVSNQVYEMSGETGSLRYMAPEVANCQPYNQKADVYSFGIILWELVAFKKPYDGMNRDEFYSRVVRGGERPILNKKWPEDLNELIKSCWDSDVSKRLNFTDIVEIIDSMLAGEEDGDPKKKKGKNRFAALIDRHSTWF